LIKSIHLIQTKNYIIMKILGYILIVIGILDVGSSWVLPMGSPIDPIVGPTIAPFTGYVLLGVGYFLTSLGGGSKEEDLNSFKDSSEEDKGN